jgi:hypothetical protein
MAESIPLIIGFFVVLGVYLYVRSRRLNKNKKK